MTLEKVGNLCIICCSSLWEESPLRAKLGESAYSKLRAIKGKGGMGLHSQKLVEVDECHHVFHNLCLVNALTPLAAGLVPRKTPRGGKHFLRVPCPGVYPGRCRTWISGFDQLVPVNHEDIPYYADGFSLTGELQTKYLKNPELFNPIVKLTDIRKRANPYSDPSFRAICEESYKKAKQDTATVEASTSSLGTEASVIELADPNWKQKVVSGIEQLAKSQDLSYATTQEPAENLTSTVSNLSSESSDLSPHSGRSSSSEGCYSDISSSPSSVCNDDSSWSSSSSSKSGYQGDEEGEEVPQKNSVVPDDDDDDDDDVVFLCEQPARKETVITSHSSSSPEPVDTERPTCSKYLTAGQASPSDNKVKAAAAGHSPKFAPWVQEFFPNGTDQNAMRSEVLDDQLAWQVHNLKQADKREWDTTLFDDDTVSKTLTSSDEDLVQAALNLAGISEEDLCAEISENNLIPITSPSYTTDFQSYNGLVLPSPPYTSASYNGSAVPSPPYTTNFSPYNVTPLPSPPYTTDVPTYSVAAVPSPPYTTDFPSFNITPCPSPAYTTDFPSYSVTALPSPQTHMTEIPAYESSPPSSPCMTEL